MFRIFAAGLCLLATASYAQEVAEIPESVKTKVNTLIERGLSDDIGYGFVRDLTTEVGPRLAGSEAEQR
ncbi:MAG: peptidase M28 family protein, partial [Pseudomonadota bacterium]